MQCEHNLDKAILLHLVLQLSDIVTCIYQVIESVKLEVLLYEEYRHQHHNIPLHLPRSEALSVLSYP